MSLKTATRATRKSIEATCALLAALFLMAFIGCNVLVWTVYDLGE